MRNPSNRYLVLIHFASKISRDPDAATRTRTIRDIVRRELAQCEAVLNTDTALAFCGISALTAHELWKALKLPISREDALSVLEISTNIASSHPGLSSWQVQTRWLVGTETPELGQQGSSSARNEPKLADAVSDTVENAA